jgi:hypothetical protein
MDISLFEKTDWKYDTSEEKSGSFFATVAFGKLYFSNEATREKMTVKYRSISVGESKGPPVGANWSKTSDPSGAPSNVGVAEGHYFGPMSFPCRGYMIGLGGSAGVVGNVFGMNQTGGALTIAVFGMAPVFASVRMWGLGRAALPGFGIGTGLALFELDE